MSKVRIPIFGRVYTVSSEDSAEHLQKCVNLLNKRITKISEKTTFNSTLDTAIYAALSFADDIIKITEDNSLKAEHDIIEKKIKDIIYKIDKIDKLDKN